METYQIFMVVFTGGGLLSIIFILYQIIGMRKERLESVWDSLCSTAKEEADKLLGKEKIKQIDDEIERRNFRRNRHLYLERIEEALIIEKPGRIMDKLLFGKALSERYMRLQAWYWSALKVYADDDRSFADVKLWHDYSEGDLDPVESAYRILSHLSDAYLKGNREGLDEDCVINPLLGTLEKISPKSPTVTAKAEIALKRRLQDLTKFGFLQSEQKDNVIRWKLSKDGKKAMKIDLIYNLLAEEGKQGPKHR